MEWGGIVSGYCSCTAGMLGYCNHIAGVLFRIDNFVKRGEIKTCTDQLSKWNIPKGKTRVKTCKVRDLIWKKGHYTNLPLNSEEERMKTKLKESFTPLSKCQEEYVIDECVMKNKIYEALKDVAPDSCFIGNCDRRRYNKPVIKTPLDYISVASDLNKDSNLDLRSKISSFENSLKITEEEREKN
ncbi:hypothetical protein ACF0H5_005246 [Mactra antiquata]